MSPSREAYKKLTEVIAILDCEGYDKDFIQKLIFMADELDIKTRPKMSPLGQMLYEQAKALNENYIAGMKAGRDQK